MDVNLINPFITAITTVLKQLGFTNIERKGISAIAKQISANGVLLNLGIVGDKNGNVVYEIDDNAAKKVAQTIMGTEISQLDEMAKSALAEMSNMLTAHSSTNLSNNGIIVDISVPTLLYGSAITVDMGAVSGLKIDFTVDGSTLAVYVSLA